MSSSSDPEWPHHCADEARAHILAAAGRDVEAIVGAMPRSAREWAAMMRRHDVRSLSGVVSVALGPALASPRLARRGDVVRIGAGLGICRGELAVFYGGSAVPMSDAQEAWSVRHLRTAS